MEKKMIPYSVYLPEELHGKLRELGKNRKAAGIVRDALEMMLSGSDLYSSGYNKGIDEASKAIYDCKEAQMIAVQGKDLGVVLSERINALRK